MSKSNAYESAAGMGFLCGTLVLGPPSGILKNYSLRPDQPPFLTSGGELVDESGRRHPRF